MSNKIYIIVGFFFLFCCSEKKRVESVESLLPGVLKQERLEEMIQFNEQEHRFKDRRVYLVPTDIGYNIVMTSKFTHSEASQLVEMVSKINERERVKKLGIGIEK